MKNTRKITGILREVKRLPSSTNGNPRYLVAIWGIGGNPYKADVTFAKTKVDSSFAYEVDNFFGKKVVAVVGDHYGSTHIESAMKD